MRGRSGLLLAGLVFVCVAQSQDSNIQFRSATIGSNEIRFESFSPIDWKPLAGTNFHSFDLQKPDPKQLRGRWSEVSKIAEFDYTAPLPSSFSKFHYYVLIETGVAEIVPQHLHGTISYTMESPSSVPSEPMFSGDISAIAAPNASLEDAGFALALDAPGKFDITDVPMSSGPPAFGIFEHREGKDISDLYRDPNGRESKLEHDQMETPGVKKAYLLRLSASPSTYLFVRWMPDESNCQFKYSLYRVSDRVTKVAENFYGCDV